MRIRSGLAAFGGLLIPLFALAAVLLMFASVANSSFGQAKGLDTAYVHGEANVRPCPRSECVPTEVFSQGRQVIVVRKVAGESVYGNSEWYEVRYGSETRFIHSSFLSATSFASLGGIELALNLGVGCIIAALFFLIRWGRLRRVAASDESSFDAFLFGSVAAVGICTVFFGFWLSQISGQPPLPFFSDVFTNLGAGFAGAAVTFVLFSSLLSHRSVDRKQFDAMLDKVDRTHESLSAEIAGLRRAEEEKRSARPADPGDELSRPHPSYLRRHTTRRKDDVMSTNTRLEELGGTGLGEVDEPAFSGLAERHRRELHVHCYRMLGSFEDAEDTVQETFLRAWRRRETFEGRSTFRAWLYRIATNACLDLLAKSRPEPATGGEVRWLQPYPDRLLDELPAGGADEPETVAVARDSIELAYLVAVQHLAPRPRAVLILRDVLGWPAKDVAELLGDSVNSVNSALQRARAGMREHLPAERQDWTGGEEEDAGTRELVRRYTEASVATDVAGLAALLRDDARSSMPPTPGMYVGRDAVVNSWVEDGFEDMGRMRAVRTFVNRQPAVAFYLWREPEGAYLPLTIDVLRVTGGAITEIVTFHDDQFPRLGLPERLPADGPE
jgi:RNA polymerase sigma-70 factor (TIGR02960 family)